MDRLTKDEQIAISALFDVAMKGTKDSRRCADFLLAWYDAAEYGPWNPMDIGKVNVHLADFILDALRVIAREKASPVELGFEREIKVVRQVWRQKREPAVIV